MGAASAAEHPDGHGDCEDVTTGGVHCQETGESTSMTIDAHGSEHEDQLQVGIASEREGSHGGDKLFYECCARWADMNSDSEELQEPSEDEGAAPRADDPDDDVDIPGDDHRAAAGTGDAQGAAGQEATAAGDSQAPSDEKEIEKCEEFRPARRSRRARRRERAKDAAVSSADTASASAVTQGMSTDLHAGVAELNWAHRFLRDALDSAESGDYGAAVAAFARLLIPDVESQLPVDQLYSVDQKRVRGGWRATVCLANGREFAGRVRATPSSATSDAMEVVIDYLVTFAKRTVEGVRARLDLPSGHR